MVNDKEKTIDLSNFGWQNFANYIVIVWLIAAVCIGVYIYSSSQPYKIIENKQIKDITGVVYSETVCANVCYNMFDDDEYSNRLIKNLNTLEYIVHILSLVMGYLLATVLMIAAQFTRRLEK